MPRPAVRFLLPAAMITALVMMVGCGEQHRLPKISRGTLPWLTDFDQGLARSKAEQKPALVSIGGSDWCIWCQRLAAEVFSQPKFEEYAKQRLVLVDIDLPQFEELPPGVLEQRRALAEKLKVDSFPTVIVYNPEGRELGRLSYQPGGPDAFIASLERLIGK